MMLRYLSRFWAVPPALAMLFCLAPYSVVGQPGVGTLRVAIREKATGEVVPAMICIASLADNTWRIPPDGMTPAPFMRNVDFIAGRQKSIEYIGGIHKKWFLGDPGPAVIMNGTFPDNPTR